MALFFILLMWRLVVRNDLLRLDQRLGVLVDFGLVRLGYFVLVGLSLVLGLRLGEMMDFEIALGMRGLLKLVTWWPSDVLVLLQLFYLMF